MRPEFDAIGVKLVDFVVRVSTVVDKDPKQVNVYIW